MLKGAVLAVGDELICGYQLDTNSQEISRRLATVPVDVVLHMSVGDDADAIEEGLRVALREAEVLIVTGGLGPTEDDLTRQVIAAHFGRALVEDDEALRRMQERFAARGRTMPHTNRIQAHIPAGSEVIQNDRGTAAGFYLEVEGRHIFVVPGVPVEMRGMLEGYILPRLQHLVGAGQYLRRAALKVYGLPESEINERIRPLMARGRNPLLGLLPHMGTITVEVAARGRTADEAQLLAETDMQELRRILGYHIISEDERDLPQVVADLLLAQGLTVGVVEVGTGGLLAARLTEPEGHERWFRHSLVEGGNGSLPNVLSGEAAALELAARARTSSDADVGLGVGSVEVTEPSTAGRLRGTTWVAADVRGQGMAALQSFSGGRAQVREWAADAALGLLRLRLLGVL